MAGRSKCLISDPRSKTREKHSAARSTCWHRRYWSAEHLPKRSPTTFVRQLRRTRNHRKPSDTSESLRRSDRLSRRREPEGSASASRGSGTRRPAWMCPIQTSAEPGCRLVFVAVVQPWRLLDSTARSGVGSAHATKGTCGYGRSSCRCCGARGSRQRRRPRWLNRPTESSCSSSRSPAPALRRRCRSCATRSPQSRRARSYDLRAPRVGPCFSLPPRRTSIGCWSRYERSTTWNTSSLTPSIGLNRSRRRGWP